MRIEGTSSDLNSKIDFSEWNWGSDVDGLLKPIADRVAEVIWDDVVDSLKEKEAYLSMDYDGRKAGVSDGEVCLHVRLIEDNAYLVIPLSEIVVDGEGMWLTKDQPEFEYDYEPMLARLHEARDVLRKWDEQLAGLIAETMDDRASAS